MKILFYIEPLVFRDDPALLGSWRGSIDDIAYRLPSDWSVALASSPYICNHLPVDRFNPGPFNYAATYMLDSKQIMTWCNQDHAAYMQDICLGKGEANHYLLERFNDIRMAFQPDIIVSWSENAYLKKIFPNKVFYMEYGPMPRAGMKGLMFFLDPFGHQIDCAFTRALKEPKTVIPSATAMTLWSRWLSAVMEDAKAKEIPAWLGAHAKGRKVNLFALQPRDWLTYEGAGVVQDPLTLLGQVADDVDSDTVVVPQWHPVSDLPSKDVKDAIMLAYPNVLFPPDEIARGHSELFVPFVDGITTVSSNVAVTAAALGKTVRVLGQCKMSVLDSAVPKRRMDAWQFLMRYCTPQVSWYDSDAFKLKLMKLYENPQSLIDGSDESDMAAYVESTP